MTIRRSEHDENILFENGWIQPHPTIKLYQKEIGDYLFSLSPEYGCKNTSSGTVNISVGLKPSLIDNLDKNINFDILDENDKHIYWFLFSCKEIGYSHGYYNAIRFVDGLINTPRQLDTETIFQDLEKYGFKKKKSYDGKEFIGYELRLKRNFIDVNINLEDLNSNYFRITYQTYGSNSWYNMACLRRRPTNLIATNNELNALMEKLDITLPNAAFFAKIAIEIVNDIKQNGPPKRAKGKEAKI